MALICTDDFGLTTGTCEGILELCKNKKINAVSVMAESDLLTKYAKELEKYRGKIQIGLHFNLTEVFNKKTQKFSLLYLISHLFLSKKTKVEIIKNLKIQLDTFEKAFNHAPDFIDGHEHVHILPSIRNLFLDELKKRYGKKSNMWIRQVSSNIFQTDTLIKMIIIQILNIGFKRKCKKYGFKYNEDFKGIYSFNPNGIFKKLLNTWLSSLSKDTLIMCHPSGKIEDIPHSKARVFEFETLLKS